MFSAFSGTRLSMCSSYLDMLIVAPEVSTMRFSGTRRGWKGLSSFSFLGCHSCASAHKLISYFFCLCVCGIKGFLSRRAQTKNFLQNLLEIIKIILIYCKSFIIVIKRNCPRCNKYFIIGKYKGQYLSYALFFIFRSFIGH
jgi:hypothetical protein